MIPYYTGSIFETKPKGLIPLNILLQKIKYPVPAMQSLINRIHKATDQGNEELKSRLKTELPFFTPAVNCSIRKYDGIIEFTGLMPFDFDKLSKQDAKDLKRELMQFPFVIAAWLSSSGHGVRGLVSVPKSNDINQYKLRFKALQQEFKIYMGFDEAPKNPVLPLFYSIDTELLYNADYCIFENIYKEKKVPNKRKVQHYAIDSDEHTVIQIARARLNQITDAGHLILRSTSYAVGGYVAEGYLTENEAFDALDSLIDDHYYLKNKAAIYKRTAREMIIKGQEKPLKL